MFRDLYKKANEDIKGDRAILDKSFLKAAQPAAKKSPVFKYSFIGTVAAAAIVLGAVFANPSVFTNVTDNIGKSEENVTENVTEVNLVQIDAVTTMAEQPTKNDTAETKKEIPQKNYTVKQNTIAVEDDYKKAVNETIGATEEPYGVAVMSLWDEADDAYTEGETQSVGMFTLRRPGGNVTEAPEEAETASEGETELATEVSTYAEMPTEVTTQTEDNNAEAEVFSYMHDLSCGYDAMTEGFVNTSVSPVTNKEEAIKRAKNEYSGEYDNVYVYHDPIECIWKVVFCHDDEVASEIIVYMNSDGITLMLVNLA